MGRAAVGLAGARHMKLYGSMSTWTRTLFGTFTPFASTWLIDKTGDKASPGFWLMFAAVLGIIAALTVYRSGRTIEVSDTVPA